MAELNEDFCDLLLALSVAGAEYAVVGGWALALDGHGRVRAPQPENASRIARRSRPSTRHSSVSV
jgi:hypothetical protein